MLLPRRILGQDLKDRRNGGHNKISMSKCCYVCLFKCGREEKGVHTAVCTLEGQKTDKLADSGLCFHQEALLDQTQAVGLGTKCLSLLNHLTGPKPTFQSKNIGWVVLFSTHKGQNMLLWRSSSTMGRVKYDSYKYRIIRQLLDGIMKQMGHGILKWLLFRQERGSWYLSSHTLLPFISFCRISQDNLKWLPTGQWPQSP